MFNGRGLSDIEDAKAALDAALGKKLVEVRCTYYDKLVNDGLSTWEFVSTVLSGYSLEIDVSIAAGYILSSNLKSIQFQGWRRGTSSRSIHIVL